MIGVGVFVIGVAAGRFAAETLGFGPVVGAAVMLAAWVGVAWQIERRSE